MLPPANSLNLTTLRIRCKCRFRIGQTSMKNFSIHWALMSHYVMYSKFGVFVSKIFLQRLRKSEVFVPSMLCQAFAVKTNHASTQRSCRSFIQILHIQQNSRVLNSVCNLDVYCILRTDVQWISNLSIFSETLDLLTKKIGIATTCIHLWPTKISPSWEFAMEVSISEASVPRCPCRVGKEISRVIPRDHRHHEPHPWTAATTATALVVLRRKHARTARKAWDWTREIGKTFGRCCWSFFLGVMTWWINKSAACAKLRYWWKRSQDTYYRKHNWCILM